MDLISHPKTLSISEFTYPLSDDRIAAFPLDERDASKLLIYHSGELKESIYRELPKEIPPGYLMVFNQTKVLPARLLFQKPSGGWIEVFCLEPFGLPADPATALNQRGEVDWTCLVGGAGKWKEGMVLAKKITGASGEISLQARMLGRNKDAFHIRFNWTGSSETADMSFASILEEAGAMPIPPYLKRKATGIDQHRYQTIYASEQGSVAAPTAGLHFTPQLLAALKKKGIDKSFLTLHVGAGTFKPVTAEHIGNHEMHAEWFEVRSSTLQQLIKQLDKIVAVGTTSLRTLESLYWLACKSILRPEVPLDELSINQWYAYETGAGEIAVEQALTALYNRMLKEGRTSLLSKTQLLMVPGYQVKMVQALITNFHQPKSTLLLLVAAMVGKDWKKIYQYALDNNFRFLSYGDGSLLWRNEANVI